MTQQTHMNVIKRPGRLKFVGSLSANHDLTDKDWRIAAPCFACGGTHEFTLASLLNTVKSVAAQTLTFTCPHTGITAGLTLSAKDVRTALKYLRRSEGRKWLVIPAKPALVERPKRANPMPAMTDWRQRAK